MHSGGCSVNRHGQNDGLAKSEGSTSLLPLPLAHDWFHWVRRGAPEMGNIGFQLLGAYSIYLNLVTG